MTKFTFYAEEQEEIAQDKLAALEKAVGEEILSILPVAVELVFLDGEGIRDYNRRFRIKLYFHIRWKHLLRPTVKNAC